MKPTEFGKKLIYGAYLLHLFEKMDDEKYLKLMYRCCFGKKLDLQNPKTFNDKLQWLKLYNRKPEYVKLADKYAVNTYVRDTVGEEYLIPTLGVWSSPEEIEFQTLPNQFVLKCTHDSDSAIVCRNKNMLDTKAITVKLKRYMKRNYFFFAREWPYFYIEPRIIAQPYLTDKSGTAVKDYKFLCFQGKVKALYVISDRFTDIRHDYFDADYHHISLQIHYPNADITPEKPKSFDQMIQLAEKLSQGFCHVRVDFYEADGRIYFGELTFFHWGGIEAFEPESYDEMFGEWIHLPKTDEMEMFE